jgi:hypothetical protein
VASHRDAGKQTLGSSCVARRPLSSADSAQGHWRSLGMAGSLAPLHSQRHCRWETQPQPEHEDFTLRIYLLMITIASFKVTRACSTMLLIFVLFLLVKKFPFFVSGAVSSLKFCYRIKHNVSISIKLIINKSHLL